jgi:hypothetical protein
MDAKPKEQQSLSKDAFLAFNNIGGQIKTRSLEILRKNMSENDIEIADKQQVQDAYWEACQEILNRNR